MSHCITRYNDLNLMNNNIYDQSRFHAPITKYW